jgi:hypothetical protein
MDSTVGGVSIMLILFAIGLVCVVGLLFILAKARRRRSAGMLPVLTAGVAAQNSGLQESSLKTNIKSCPTCHSTYTDATLRYCLVDGASLEDATASALSNDPAATIKINNRGDSKLAPTVQYQPEMKDDKGNV